MLIIFSEYATRLQIETAVEHGSLFYRKLAPYESMCPLKGKTQDITRCTTNNYVTFVVNLHKISQSKLLKQIKALAVAQRAITAA